jgi:hypothetical protein
MSALRLLLAVTSVLLTAGWHLPPQQQTVTVVGPVTNGTPGGEVPAGLEVHLRVLNETGAEEERYPSTLDAQGTFRVEGVAVGPEQTLIAEVDYQDVTYTSEPAEVDAAAGELLLPVTIYESTDDPAQISVTQLHLFVMPGEEVLQLSEYHLISNEGQRTYVGQATADADRPTTLTFLLPEGAAGLRFNGPGLGERFVERPQGFADTRPIPPGTATVEVLFSYELPYRPGVEVERLFGVPVASVIFLVPGEEFVVRGAGLVPQGTVDTQMGSAQSFLAGPVPAGEPLAFSVGPPSAEAPPPEAMPAPSPRNVLGEVSVGLLSVALAILVALLLWRPAVPAAPPAEVQSLVGAIADLDRAFERQEIPEAEYARQRAALKRQIRHQLEAGHDD